MKENTIIWFVPAIAVSIGILLLSTVLSIPVQVEGVGYLDKIEHCFAYFVLALSYLFAFKKSGRLNQAAAIQLVFLASLYGLSLEFVQYALFPNRYFEWIDAAANVLGVLIGFGAFKVFDRG